MIERWRMGGTEQELRHASDHVEYEIEMLATKTSLEATTRG
jgi:hypothetical protein